ncbi:MAG: hypothetical protein IMF19_04405 [Proteobacteria bacterium]|nr:hypothetical protein [Pseudomonadota bacterium]
MAISRIPRIILDGDEESSSYMAREGIRQLGILKDLMGFNSLQQDIRKVEYTDGSIILCRSCFEEDVVYIYTEKKEEEKADKRFYIYVTISDYVTIWDSYTGEVAEGICNNDGDTYDEDGNSLITFPCHKDELVRWLEGIPNKPTRQVLKDEPESNRDYLEDNKLDIGNENRVEYAHPSDPSYELYYGVGSTVTFVNTVRNELIDELNPYCCWGIPCAIAHPDYAIYGTLVEKNTPNPITLVGCTPEEVSDSFSCSRDLDYGKDCKMHGGMPGWVCRRCNYATFLKTSVKYIQKFFMRTKHLYLGPYPSPTYLRPTGDSGLEEVEYAEEKESVEGRKDGSAYDEAIDMEWDNTNFVSSNWLSAVNWSIKKEEKRGDVVSINTKLGALMIDYTPYKEWVEDTERVHERMRSVTDDSFLSTYLRDGVCNSVSEWEQRAILWRDTIHPPTNPPVPDHAEEELMWCRNEARSPVNVRDSESNRTGITWCGSSTPRDELNEEGEAIKEAVTKDWYRVILNFYMGGFHTGGNEAMQNWNANPFYCPDEEMCEELMEQYGGAGAECTATSWANKLIERFSSVQATIELEKPEDYPKIRSDTCEHCVVCEEETPGCIDGQRCTEPLRYKRPDEYEGHEEDFTSLCAFPGRTQGYPEDEENDICYPFDGTYDIFNLGKAVEELINNHYEDGSDDQLLVYLYKRNT